MQEGAWMYSGGPELVVEEDSEEEEEEVGGGGELPRYLKTC